MANARIAWLAREIADWEREYEEMLIRHDAIINEIINNLFVDSADNGSNIKA